jgi:hypothetical protein
VAVHDLIPHLRPGCAHRAHDPRPARLTHTGDLIQTAPRSRHRRDRPVQLLGLAEGVDSGNDLGSVRDTHRQIHQDPAAVMHRDKPAPTQRLRQLRREPDPVGQHPQRGRAGMRHEILPITRDHKITRPAGKLIHEKCSFEPGRTRT